MYKSIPSLEESQVYELMSSLSFQDSSSLTMQFGLSYCKWTIVLQVLVAIQVKVWSCLLFLIDFGSSASHLKIGENVPGSVVLGLRQGAESIKGLKPHLGLSSWTALRASSWGYCLIW